MTLRALSIVGALSSAVMSWAGTINVTSPQSGDFLGLNNTLRFTGENWNAQVRVTVRVRSVATGNVLFTRQQNFDPNGDNEISGSIDLNFNNSTPEGLYTIEVGAPLLVPTNPLIINNLTIDVNEPKFLNVSPLTGQFVKGIVNILASLQEPNVDEWRVQVNGQDIPNNTGSSTTINVPWDTSSVQRDGEQNINIRVEDQAKNNANRSLNLTVDRRAPEIQIIAPSTTAYRRGASIPVAIDLNDQFNSSVNVNNLDVRMTTMAGAPLGRVARATARNSGTKLQWTGRIRFSRNLPNQFKVVATATDRAGNVATNQEVVVTIR